MADITTTLEISINHNL